MKPSVFERRGMERPGKLFLLLFVFTCGSALFAQQTGPGKTLTGKSNFAVPAFTPVFAENLGQFNSFAEGEFSYGSMIGRGMVLFGVNSMQIIELLPDRDGEEEEKPGELKKELGERKFKKHVKTMRWVGANPGATFETGIPVEEYFTYPDPANKQLTLRANAWQTITCKNLYPGIDVTYTFYEKGGVKYFIHLAPGADPSVIRIKWSGVDEVSIDASGNLSMPSGTGTVTDAAPVSNYADDAASTIRTHFVLHGKEVRFQLGDYDNTRAVVIDPWVNSPGFPGGDKAFDIAQENTGDIYVYGGSNPFQLKKFTAVGVPVWTFNTMAGGYYGDFCLDNAGNIFVVYGPWGDQCVKLTNAGVMVFNVNSGTNTWNKETYRVELSQVTGQLLVMGMEIPGAGGQYPMVFTIDPNTGAYSPTVLHATCAAGEVRDMAVDQATGDTYGISFHAVPSTNPAVDNFLWKVDPALNTAWSQPDGYLLGEVDISYTNEWFSGHNGLMVSCDVITYDGVTVKRWDKATGILLSTATITGGVSYKLGGLCTDACGNIYVGGPNAVHMFDPNLTPITTVATPDSVFDVCRGVNPGEIFACGKGFFASLSFTVPSCSQTTMTSVNATTCPCDGSATINVSQFCSAGTYTYQWFPSGGTGSTASNLCPGTYTVVYTNTTTNAVDSATVTITGTVVNVTVTSTAVQPSCNSSNGSITASPSGGTGPYTYLWSPGNQVTQTITNVGPGTYTVTVTDSLGCSAFQVITLNPSTGMTASLSSAAPFCSACNGSATVTPSGGSPGYQYSWSTNPVQASATATGLCAGTYSVTITDTAGCSFDTLVTITATNPMTVTATVASPLLCFGDCNGSLTATPANGQGPYTYSWNTNPVQNTATATGLCSGTYSVTVTDSNNCATGITLALTEPTALTVQSVSPVSACEGDCGMLTANVAGGTPTYTYAWTPGPLSGNNVSVCPSTSTTYYVTVSDDNNCSISDSVQFIVNPLPAIAFAADTLQGCELFCVNLTNNTPNSASVTWIYGDNTTGTASSHCYADGTYDVGAIVVNDNGCIDTLVYSAYITAFPQPVANFTVPAQPVSIWEPQICFSDLSANATNWMWDFDDPFDPSGSTAQFPCHLYSDTGIYCVQQVALTAAGCPDTMELCFEIFSEEGTLYVPNTFTPNGNGDNEIFFPYGIGIDGNNYHFMVFDRWGMLIYETRVWGEGWDGTYKGNKCQVDTYVWKVDCKDIIGNNYNRIGHVNLIR